MRGLIAFAYGVAAYVMGVAALLYFIGFSGNLFVPKSVDGGPPLPWSLALCIDLPLLALFGLQHSVMARRGFKQRWTRLVPESVERSTYLVATALTMAVLFWCWVPISAPVVWRVDNGIVAALVWCLFGLGWMLVLLSTFLINHFELFGLQQVYLRLKRRAMPDVQFRTPGLYRHVRHPLYLGLLLGLWAVPLMSAGHLLFVCGLSAYILVGVAFEERDLMAKFGDRYRQYRADVGMLLPRLGRAKRPVTPSREKLTST